MAKALEHSRDDPTYLDFFGFTRPPFARLSKPAQIFHTEQYSLLMAHLAAATEQPDCMVVVCGADGSGKTTLLNRYITSLGDDVCFATIDETCGGEKEFYTSFLRQLGFSEITGTARELRRISKEFLVHRGMAGEPVLIMIDNAQLVNAAVFDQLRRMSAIKVNNQRVLSVVLAGTADLDRIMDSPAMSQVKFASQVHFNIRVYTEEETANYIWHRLRLAGGGDAVKFSSDAHPLVYRYTGGIPKLINTLCDNLLEEAFDRKMHEINEELVRAVADSRKLLPHVVPLQGKGRRKTDPDFKLMQPDPESSERITPRDSATQGAVEKPVPQTSKVSAADTNLLEQISELSQQVGELRSGKTKVMEEMGERDKQNAELRSRLETLSAEHEKLLAENKKADAELKTLKNSLAESEADLKKSRRNEKKLSSELEKEQQHGEATSKQLAETIEDHNNEVEQIKKALADSMKALQKSEKSSDQLTSDLEKQRKAVHSAEAETGKANSRIEKLEKEKAELQEALNDLESELAETKERDTSALEDEIEQKNDELAALRDELSSRDASISDLEKQFKEIQKECASLRLRVAARKTLQASVSEKEARIADLQAQLDSQSEELEKLKIKGDSPETDDVSESQAEQIENLEVELEEARKMLTGIQEALTESDDSPDQDPMDLTGDVPQVEFESDEKPQIIFADFDNDDDEISIDAESQIEVEEIPLSDEVSEIFLETAESKVAPENVETLNVPSKKKQQARESGNITVLEVFRNGESKQLYKIPTNEDRIMIGRSDDSELRLKSEFVSRHHSLVIRDGDDLYIEDLNSFNGTLVNSQKVSRQKLKPGDTITIGKFEIKPRTS
ncbi:MAG: AAA family ATPase [Woeseiaceae bacterium]|nr:AAA family ATPase [Woeseiaceae bacterium]